MRTFGSNRAPSTGTEFMATEELTDLVRAFRAPIAAAGALLVLLLLWWAWPDSADESLDLVHAIRPPALSELIIDAASAETLGSLVAAERLVVRGVVYVPSDRVFVANEMVFEPDARLVAPAGHVTILAPRFARGVVDVSGRDGADAVDAGDAGADGTTGGTLFVAAADIEALTLVAGGGDGGDGQRGYSGARGQNGVCGPRSFRLAEPGDTGGDGGAAGDGGTGGAVNVFYRYAPPAATAIPGAAGAPGHGGPGGRGGAGCKGIRGTQAARPPGNDGVAGRAGTKGLDGSVRMRRVAFSAVVDVFDDWLDEGTGTPAKLRDRLLTLQPLDE